jgi:hypothetical protein
MTQQLTIVITDDAAIRDARWHLAHGERPSVSVEGIRYPAACMVTRDDNDAPSGHVTRGSTFAAIVNTVCAIAGAVVILVAVLT